MKLKAGAGFCLVKTFLKQYYLSEAKDLAGLIILVKRVKSGLTSFR
jgi:hypothetical protein